MLISHITIHFGPYIIVTGLQTLYFQVLCHVRTPHHPPEENVLSMEARERRARPTRRTVGTGAPGEGGRAIAGGRRRSPATGAAAGAADDSDDDDDDRR